MKVKPDFIILNDPSNAYCPKITGLKFVNIPYGIILGDIDPIVISEKKAFIKENNVKYIFYIYRDAFSSVFSELNKENSFWLPHFVNTDIFKDYGLSKDVNYLVMGMVHNWYPLRQRIIEKMRNEAGFIYHRHPGYGVVDKGKDFVREKYAKEINRARIFFTDDSIFHYPLLKYFEVLACKTLLLAPSSRELEDLGFIDGINFVSIDMENFADKARYYLEHPIESKHIAEQGYKMVREKHSAAVRSEEFLNVVNNILERINEKN